MRKLFNSRAEARAAAQAAADLAAKPVWWGRTDTLWAVPLPVNPRYADGLFLAVPNEAVRARLTYARQVYIAARRILEDRVHDPCQAQFYDGALDYLLARCRLNKADMDRVLRWLRSPPRMLRELETFPATSREGAEYMINLDEIRGCLS